MSVRQFARDFMLPLPMIAQHDPSVITVLAQLSDVDVSDLLRWSFSKRKNFLAGHKLTPQAVRRDAIFGCPICLREEISANEGPIAQRVPIRGDWQISAISVCFTHEVLLIPFWRSSNVSSKTVFDEYFASILKIFHSGDLNGVRQVPTDFERWLDRQLEQRDEAGWLGTFSLFEAADLCLWIGQLILALEGKLAERLPDAAAYERGFSIASQGKENVHSVLRDIQLFHSPSAAKTEVLGRLYSSFNTHSNIRLRPRIASFVREHVVRYWPLGPGDTCLFERVEKRHIHSLTSAARTMGVKPREAKSILSSIDDAASLAEKRMNAIGQFSLEQVAAAKHIADRIAAEAERAVAKLVSAQVVQSTFGIPQKDFKSMRRDGLLAPEMGSAEKARWSLEKVDDFFADIEKGIAKVADRPQDPGWMTIPELCWYCGTRPGRIFEHIVESKFSNIVVLQSTKRYEAILIKPSKKWLGELGVAGHGITICDFAKLIKVTRGVAYNIVCGGLIRIEWKRFPTECRTRMLISSGEVKRFQNEYVSEAQIGALTGESRQALAKCVSRVCMTGKGANTARSLPLFKWAEVEAKLFCRWPNDKLGGR